MVQDSKPPVRVRTSPIEGRGLVATRDIAKGERIIEYTGEKVTKAEAERRYERQEAAGRIYLFDLNSRYDVDGAKNGSIARYANHSCDPNTETEIARGHIWLVARKSIKAGDEVVYDYNFPLDGFEDRPCRCGTAKCRGYIVGASSAGALKRVLNQRERERKAKRTSGSKASRTAKRGKGAKRPKTARKSSAKRTKRKRARS